MMLDCDQPAFPSHEECDSLGMTVREYFAIKIYAALAGNPEYVPLSERTVQYAVEQADLLIDTLNKTGRKS